MARYIISYDLDIENRPYYIDGAGKRHKRDGYVRNHFNNPENNLVYQTSNVYSCVSLLNALELINNILESGMFVRTDTLKVFEVNPDNSAESEKIK